MKIDIKLRQWLMTEISQHSIQKHTTQTQYFSYDCTHKTEDVENISISDDKFLWSRLTLQIIICHWVDDIFLDEKKLY